MFGSGGDNVVYSSVACQLTDDDLSEHAVLFAMNASDGSILWTMNATAPLLMFDYSVVGVDGTLIVEEASVAGILVFG
jgi:hypothetical protein